LSVSLFYFKKSQQSQHGAGHQKNIKKLPKGRKKEMNLKTAEKVKVNFW